MAAKKCDNLMFYLTGKLSESEKVRFREHLKECSACSAELQALQEAWFALSYDIDEEQAPASLKSDVMDFVFEEHSTSQKQTRLDKWLNAFKQSFTPLTTVLLTILFFGWIGLFWNDLHLRKTIHGYEEVAREEPIQIKDTSILRSEDSFSQAEGVAYLIREGEEKKIVMLINHMPKTEGNEVYQAWLLYDGKRQNCGTFRPNPNGRGVLTYRLRPLTHFEDIEITLESNPYSSQPHGQKVMGTF